MNIYSDEFDITKIKDNEIKTLLKKRDKQIEKIVDFSNLADATRNTFYNENHKLYHDFSKAVEQLPLEYTNKEIEDAINKLKQLILMRQFLKPYREKFIFSDINFLTTENKELDRYRRIILDNINGLTEQSLIKLESDLGIENFNKTSSKKQGNIVPKNSPGRESKRSPDSSSNNNSVNSASIESSAGTSQNYNNNYISVSPNPSLGSKKRKKHKKKKNKGTVKGRTNEKKKKTEIKRSRR